MSETSRRASEEVLGIARRTTDRLLSLVEALLDAARREGLGIRIDQEPLDLADVLGAVVDNMSAVARSSDVELVLELPPDLPQPPGDRSQLERVLGNLVDNAISYTPVGGRVVVAAAARDTGAEVSVTDTGSGIPLEYREHIFDRFSRVPGAQGRRRGFGLGLYFCRQVVQAHGGQIWVESGPQDVGSHFVFTLPQNGAPQS
jgi:NtrC-family two-component system sensor histidine kinase KinB